uniref:Uncharacterized protein n=1 Tax=virus sp. ct8MV80 TaxID=2826793 RepID=A0A8S5R7I5_9VIRU|nr:MAG TPA: hypothetical protein [virus sp. ct8MV80]
MLILFPNCCFCFNIFANLSFISLLPLVSLKG